LKNPKFFVPKSADVRIERNPSPLSAMDIEQHPSSCEGLLWTIGQSLIALSQNIKTKIVVGLKLLSAGLIQNQTFHYSHRIALKC